MQPKFQKLNDVQTLVSERGSSPASLAAFYNDLRETAIMYKEFWEELSSYITDISSISSKAESIYNRVQNVKQQWEFLSPRIEEGSEARDVYTYFCNNVLYEDMEKNLEGSESLRWSIETEKTPSLKLNGVNNLVDFEKSEKEKETKLISAMVNSVYEQRKRLNCNVPLRFHGREDFLDFLTDKRLPAKITRKKKEIVSASICPYFFILIMIILSLGRNYEAPFNTFEMQYQFNLEIFGLQSKVNDMYEYKFGVFDTISIESIRDDIFQRIKAINDSESQIILQSFNEKSDDKKIKGPEISLWMPAGDKLNLSLKEATSRMLESIRKFSKTEIDSITPNDENYLFWSYNIQNQYYTALNNATVWSMKQFKKYAETMPFNNFLGVFFFVCTILIIFVNYLNTCEIVTLGNNILEFYLRISQPELDNLKKNCQAFINYFDKENNINNSSDVDEKKSSIPKISISYSRLQVHPLKQFRKPRTTLESRLYILTGLLTLVCFLLFLMPIPFQRRFDKLSKSLTEEFSALLDLETCFAFSLNILKQELICPLPVFGSENKLLTIQRHSEILESLSQRLIFLNEINRPFLSSEHNELFNKVMIQSFCDVLEKPSKERCFEFENGQLSKGLKYSIDKKIRKLVEIIEQYVNFNKTESNAHNKQNIDNEQKIKFLKIIKGNHFDIFREIFLKQGFERIRKKFPDTLSGLFLTASRKLWLYEFVICFIWSILTFLDYFKVIVPLLKIVEERKKLIRIIPFPLLISMKDDVAEFLEKYCDLNNGDKAENGNLH